MYYSHRQQDSSFKFDPILMLINIQAILLFDCKPCNQVKQAIIQVSRVNVEKIFNNNQVSKTLNLANDDINNNLYIFLSLICRLIIMII